MEGAAAIGELSRDDAGDGVVPIGHRPGAEAADIPSEGVVTQSTGFTFAAAPNSIRGVRLMPKRMRFRRLIVGAGLGALLLSVVSTLGCVRVSNGVWYFKSAELPQGWPELTPVGAVEVKTYPEYRAATVVDTDLEGAGTDEMFMSLFGHIQRRKVAMTAPVDMQYADPADPDRMTAMAFLYRTPDLGETGADGAVRVEDLPSRTYASVGVRGGYSSENFRRGLSLLDGWLAGNGQWESAGPARYLGYNGPFVLPFLRYGEVQIAVEPAAVAPDAASLPLLDPASSDADR